MKDKLFLMTLAALRLVVWVVLITGALIALVVGSLLPSVSAVSWDVGTLRILAGALAPMVLLIGALVGSLTLFAKPVSQYRALLTLCLTSAFSCLFCWLFHLGFEQYIISMSVAMTWCIWDKVVRWRKC